MILMHMAFACPHMIPCRAIWTHFKPNSKIFLVQDHNQVLHLVLDLVLDQGLDLKPIFSITTRG